MPSDIVIAWMMLAVLAFVITIMLCSCATPARLTTETVWPGDPALVVVEWPPGTDASQVGVYDIDGRVQVVAPLAESVY